MQSRLRDLEFQSISRLREAFLAFPVLGMLWSMGKDSTVVLRLAEKAFDGQIPFPVFHIDTKFKIPEMISFRDETAIKLKLDLWIATNQEALALKRTFPDGNLNRTDCCASLKTQPLQRVISGDGPFLRMDHAQGKLIEAQGRPALNGLILGIRTDEEGSRSKERVFSKRSADKNWLIEDQAPEVWDYVNSHITPGTHYRVHPLLGWTEVDVWRYVEAEKISLPSLYFDQGQGWRYRSLGCGPCTKPIPSKASSAKEIVLELTEGAYAGVSERSGRGQDEVGSGLEALRRKGYM